MLLRSGANADIVPVWAAVVTGVHPQPPGTHWSTTDVNVFRPVSNPSFRTVEGVQAGVPVAVPVGVLVAVAVGVGVEPPHNPSIATVYGSEPDAPDVTSSTTTTNGCPAGIVTENVTGPPPPSAGLEPESPM
jgi:hypothetical protein